MEKGKMSNKVNLDTTKNVKRTSKTRGTSLKVTKKQNPEEDRKTAKRKDVAETVDRKKLKDTKDLKTSAITRTSIVGKKFEKPKGTTATNAIKKDATKKAKDLPTTTEVTLKHNVTEHMKVDGALVGGAAQNELSLTSAASASSTNTARTSKNEMLKIIRDERPVIQPKRFYQKGTQTRISMANTHIMRLLSIQPTAEEILGISVLDQRYYNESLID